MSIETKLNESELARMEESCESATAGPWKSFIEGRDHEAGSSFIRTAGPDIELCGASQADQDFIASARQDIPTLLSEVRKLRAELNLMKKPDRG